MKRANIGGGVYLDVGIGMAPPGPVQFMSEKWKQLIARAFSRADPESYFVPAAKAMNSATWIV